MEEEVGLERRLGERVEDREAGKCCRDDFDRWRDLCDFMTQNLFKTSASLMQNLCKTSERLQQKVQVQEFMKNLDR